MICLGKDDQAPIMMFLQDSSRIYLASMVVFKFSLFFSLFFLLWPNKRMKIMKVISLLSLFR